MREIKFRAWITDECKRGYKTNQMFSDEDVKNELVSDVKFKSLFWNQNGIIPMQFTGLKDKNGKEIYEGDIVKTKSGKLKDIENPGKFHAPIKFIGEVIYEGCFFRLKQHQVGGPKTIGDLFTPILEHHLIKEIIVVGNIYENPELLK